MEDPLAVDTDYAPHRDAAMTRFAGLIRPLTHPRGEIAEWACNVPDWLSLARYGVLVTAPLTSVLIVTGNATLAWIAIVSTCVLLAGDLVDGPWARVISGPTYYGRHLDTKSDMLAIRGLVVAIISVAIYQQRFWMLGFVMLRLGILFVHILAARAVWRRAVEPRFPHVPLGYAEQALDIFTAVVLLASGIAPQALGGIALACVILRCAHEMWRFVTCTIYLCRLRKARAVLQTQQRNAPS